MTTEEPAASKTDTVPEPGKLPQPGLLPSGSRVVLRRHSLFTGRKAQLLALADALLYQPGRSAAQTVVVCGPDGIGKTQLAVEFVYRYGRFFAGGVYWLSFAHPETVPDLIAACGRADALNLHPDFDRLQLKDQLTLVQRAWQEPVPRLLVFDNCEDEALLDKWRPSAGGCRVLVTSQLGWRRRPGVTAFPLGGLQRSESIAWLRRAVPDLGEADAGAVAAALGDLPLALRLAGRLLAHHGDTLSPQAYLDRLRHHSFLPAQPSLEERGQTPSPPHHELNLGRAFAINYDRLDPSAKVDAVARYLLACAASLAPGEPIPRDLLLAALPRPQSTLWARLHRRLRPKTASFTTGADEQMVQAALDRLLQLGLLTLESSETLRLHRRLAQFVPGLAGVAEAQAAVEQALLAALSSQIDRVGYLGPLPSLATHLRFVTDRAQPRRDTAAASLCNQLGYYLHERGDYDAARNYLEQALAIRHRRLGPQHLQTASSLNNLGLLLQDIGDHVAARDYLEQALAVFRRELGQQHLQTASSLNNLGFLLRAMGDYPTARDYLEQALAIQRRLLGQEHLDVAQTLNNLGRLLHELGDYPGARSCLERALAVYQHLLGRQHPATATVYNNLGALLQDAGDLPAAQEYYQQALAIRRQLLGQHHPATIASLNNLSSLLYARDSVSNKSGL